MLMTIRDEHWGVIVNPYAGTKKLKRDRVEIFQLMKRAEIRFLEQTTEYAGHATEIARTLVNKGFNHLLIIGGDGTINEVINGIYSSDVEDKSGISIAVIPYGTGNDWARYWGLLKRDRRKLSTQLFKRDKVMVDIGKVSYIGDNGKDQCRYFINGAGFGFDAKVANITNKLKKYLGGSSWTYTLSVFMAVFSYKSTPMKILCDDGGYSGEVFTMAIGNGCYSGGGLKQVPEADPRDGLFHVTAIEKPTFIKILYGLKDLLRGDLDKHPCAHTFVTSGITIQQKEELIFETDGVLLPAKRDVKLDVIHHAIGMYV